MRHRPGKKNPLWSRSGLWRDVIWEKEKVNERVSEGGGGGERRREVEGEYSEEREREKKMKEARVVDRTEWVHSWGQTAHNIDKRYVNMNRAQHWQSVQMFSDGVSKLWVWPSCCPRGPGLGDLVVSSSVVPWSKTLSFSSVSLRPLLSENYGRQTRASSPDLCQIGSIKTHNSISPTAEAWSLEPWDCLVKGRGCVCHWSFSDIIHLLEWNGQ